MIQITDKWMLYDKEQEGWILPDGGYYIAHLCQEDHRPTRPDRALTQCYTCHELIPPQLKISLLILNLSGGGSMQGIGLQLT